jgi:hypothetical protein
VLSLTSAFYPYELSTEWSQKASSCEAQAASVSGYRPIQGRGRPDKETKEWLSEQQAGKKALSPNTVTLQQVFNMLVKWGRWVCDNRHTGPAGHLAPLSLPG